MKIALVAPAEERVPPIAYGGSELVIANLANGLVARGHEVHLFASGDSLTRAILHPLFDRSIRSILVERGEFQNSRLRMAYSNAGILRAIEGLTEERFDVIHNHMNWRLMGLAGIFSAPLVTTWHTDPSEEYVRAVAELYPEAVSISISDSQRRARPDLRYEATVYNGIDVDAFPFQSKQGDYLAFLGRICPEKGIKEAVLAAKAAGMPLKIAAFIDPIHQAYWDTEILPHVDGTSVQYLGEVGHAGKAKLLSGAAAILGLIQWEEPFGLFMAEALACGTPVIATRRGSVPELVVNGVTGFIVENTPEAAADAVRRLPEISRERCRQEAVERFSIERMVKDYEVVYQNAAAGLFE